MDCTQSCHKKYTLCLSGRSGSENCNCTANSSVQQHHQVGILSNSHSTCAWRDHSCWHCTSGRHGHCCRSMKRDRNCGHHNTWRPCRQLEEQPSHCSTADGWGCKDYFHTYCCKRRRHFFFTLKNLDLIVLLEV